MSETPLALVREALTAKLSVDLRRPHAATAAAQQVAVLAALLVEELAGDRARGGDAELSGDDDDLELQDLLEARFPPPAPDDDPDDEPGGPS